MKLSARSMPANAARRPPGGWMSPLRTIVVLGLVRCTLACDQGTKRLAETALKDQDAITMLAGTVRFVYAENTGAWGSLGANWAEPVKQAVFVVLPVLVLLGFLLMALVSRDLTRWHLLGFALIVGGGLGNILDRVRLGYVVDFVHMGVSRLQTNIFNVADVVLLVGMALIFLRKKQRRFL